jgi:serine/threonine protein kinase
VALGPLDELVQGRHVPPVSDMIFPGYTLHHEIFRGQRRLLFRGTRASDGLAVVIKTAADEFPTPAQLAALRREFAILSSLQIEGVVRPVDLVTHRDRVALVLHDPGGISLKTLIASGALPLSRTLDTGIQLATILGQLHRLGIIHKDINPNNIVIDPDSGRATLTDFGIASRLSSEQQAPRHPHLLEGTIARCVLGQVRANRSRHRHQSRRCTVSVDGGWRICRASAGGTHSDRAPASTMRSSLRASPTDQA